MPIRHNRAQVSPLRLKITLLIAGFGPLIAIGSGCSPKVFQLMSFLRTIPAALTAALLASPAALAETVTLTLLNGDTIQGELIPEESTDDVKVLMHPQLGRLESQDASSLSKSPRLENNHSAGINAGNKDGDGTFSANINGSSNYRVTGTSSSSKPV